MYFAALSYAFSVILVAGGFLCLYLGIRLVRMRSKSAESRSNFSGKWGDIEFSIGAGSLAALTMALSVVWAGAGIATLPNMEYLADAEGERIRVSAMVDKLEEVDQKVSAIKASQDEVSDNASLARIWVAHRDANDPKVKERVEQQMREAIEHADLMARAQQRQEEHPPLPTSEVWRKPRIGGGNEYPADLGTTAMGLPSSSVRAPKPLWLIVGASILAAGTAHLIWWRVRRVRRSGPKPR